MASANAASGAGALGPRAARGAMALAFRAVIVLGVGLLRTAIVARVLGPEELGIFTLVVSVVEASRALTTLGPAAVLVQRASIDQTHIDTYWVFKIVQGALTGILVLCAYPFVEAAQPRSAMFVLHALVGAAVVIAAFGSPGDMLATRDAKFTKIAWFEMAVALIDCAIVAALTLWLRSVIALGIGSLVRAAIEMALSYWFFPLRASFRVHRDTRDEYLRAGGHFFTFAIGTYVTIYGERALIGLLFGAHALGLYAAAYRLAEVPLSIMFGITRRLLFPVLSRLNGERAALERAVRESVLLQMVLLAPCGMGTIVFAEPLIRWSFGPEYVSAVPVLQCLSLLTVARGVVSIAATLLQSAGRFDLVSRSKWWGVVVFVPGVLVGMWLGQLNGAALGAGVGYAASAAVTAVAAWDQLGVPRRSMLRPLLAPIAYTVPAGACGWLGLEFLGDVPSIAMFTTVYIATVAAAERPLTVSVWLRTRAALTRNARAPAAL